VVAAGRYGQQLAELGKAAGVKIVTETFERAAALARELGGEAKPSGAGGGDIGVALFATPEAAALFARACQPALSVLDVSLARSGVHRPLRRRAAGRNERTLLCRIGNTAHAFQSFVSCRWRIGAASWRRARN
jgi:hypothetical protein